MTCPDCKGKLIASGKNTVLEGEIIETEYFCFGCYTLFECHSQSGDMVEENLYRIGEIE